MSHYDNPHKDPANTYEIEPSMVSCAICSKPRSEEDCTNVETTPGFESKHVCKWCIGEIELVHPCFLCGSDADCHTYLVNSKPIDLCWQCEGELL